jgi:hypothetical protein
MSALKYTQYEFDSMKAQRDSYKKESLYFHIAFVCMALIWMLTVAAHYANLPAAPESEQLCPPPPYLESVDMLCNQ